MTPEQEVTEHRNSIATELSALEAKLGDVNFLPAGMVPTQDLLNQVANIGAAVDDAWPPEAGYFKEPNSVAISTKPERGGGNDPLLIDVGDQPPGKRIQLIVWIGKAEPQEIPGLVGYPQITMIDSYIDADKAGVLEVYEWDVNTFAAPSQLTYLINRLNSQGQPSSQGLVGAAVAIVIDESESWLRDTELKGYSKDFALDDHYGLVVSAVYEGSQESPTSGEVLADVEMNMSHPDGDQDSGHLLIVRDAPEIFDADLFKNGNSTDRSFIVIGGSN